TFIISWPTAPVAPRMATLYCFTFVLLSDETFIDHGDRLFKVFVLHADDDVDLIAALRDHADIDAAVAQRREQPAADARPRAHVAAHGGDQGDLIDDADAVRLHFTADIIDDVIDDVFDIAAGDDDAERVNAAGD